MNSTNILKVAVPFLAGLVVALGGALIYVKSGEPNHIQTAPVQTSQPVQQAAAQPAVSPTPVQTAPQDSPAPDPPQAAATPVQPKQLQPSAPERKPVRKELVQAKKHKVHRAVNQEEDSAAPPPPAPDPVQTAQAAPPAQNAQPEPQAQPAPPPPPQPQVVTLQPGTTLKVRLGETLSTDHNYTGDTFRATLETPIIRNGYIIADRGAQVLGRIVNAEKAGKVQGVADLTLALTAINTTDGQRISVQTNTTDIKGASSRKRDAAEIAGGSALGAIIGAIAGGGKGAAIGAGAGGGAGTVGALSTRGKAAVVPAETPLTFQLNSPVTITEKMNQ